MKLRRGTTPLSPVRSKSPLDTLATRYESVTRSAQSSFSEQVPQQSNVIELGDSDDDQTPQYYVPLPAPSTSPAPPAPSSDIEEGEDPALVELRARARARAAARTAQAKKASATPEVREEQAPSPVVQLLMTSEIPGTNPLMVKVRLNTTLEKPREAWCTRQGFTPAQSQQIFITFKMREIYDTTRVERLDLEDVGNGYVRMRGDETYYDEENMARPQVQLWTRELFVEHLKRETEEAAAEKNIGQSSTFYEDSQATPEEPEPVAQIHLLLRAKDKNVWKIIVKPVRDPLFGSPYFFC